MSSRMWLSGLMLFVASCGSSTSDVRVDEKPASIMNAEAIMNERCLNFCKHRASCMDEVCFHDYPEYPNFFLATTEYSNCKEKYCESGQFAERFDASDDYLICNRVATCRELVLGKCDGVKVQCGQYAGSYARDTEHVEITWPIRDN